MKEQREYPVELKRAAVERVVAGARARVVAQELNVKLRSLHQWLEKYRAGGVEALHGCGRPRKQVATSAARAWADGGDELSAAKRQIAELQRKVGEQQVDLDFFRRALRHVKARQRASAVPGAAASTRSSRR